MGWRGGRRRYQRNGPNLVPKDKPLHPLEPAWCVRCDAEMPGKGWRKWKKGILATTCKACGCRQLMWQYKDGKCIAEGVLE